jgi:MFS transporter, SHS family, lactate transporter
LAFVVIDIEKSFADDRALAGALGTVTLGTRALGGILAGTAVDKIGRKLPLMLSILWFSLFAFVIGFSRSYAMLLLGVNGNGCCRRSIPDIYRKSSQR